MFALKRFIGSSLFVFLIAATALAQESRAPIDNPRENDNPDAMIFVTVRKPDGGPYLGGGGIEVRYTQLAPANRWRFWHNDGGIEAGQQFNVLIIIP